MCPEGHLDVSRSFGGGAGGCEATTLSQRRQPAAPCRVAREEAALQPGRSPFPQAVGTRGSACAEATVFLSAFLGPCTSSHRPPRGAAQGPPASSGSAESMTGLPRARAPGAPPRPPVAGGEVHVGCEGPEAGGDLRAPEIPVTRRFLPLGPLRTNSCVSLFWSLHGHRVAGLTVAGTPGH